MSCQMTGRPSQKALFRYLANHGSLRTSLKVQKVLAPGDVSPHGSNQSVAIR
jgi:hypothetical protein